MSVGGGNTPKTVNQKAPADNQRWDPKWDEAHIGKQKPQDIFNNPVASHIQNAAQFCFAVEMTRQIAVETVEVKQQGNTNDTTNSDNLVIYPEAEG
jgi:hypothetical protein